MRKNKYWVSFFFFPTRADISYWRSWEAGRVTGTGRAYGAGAWIWVQNFAGNITGAWLVRWSPNFVRWKIWCRWRDPWWWWDEWSSQDAAVGGRTCGKVVRLTGAWRLVRCFLTSIFLWMRERVPTIRTIDGILWTEASVNDNRGRKIRLREGYRLWGNFW